MQQGIETENGEIMVISSVVAVIVVFALGEAIPEEHRDVVRGIMLLIIVILWILRMVF
jgi:hypothetical protein